MSCFDKPKENETSNNDFCLRLMTGGSRKLIWEAETRDWLDIFIIFAWKTINLDCCQLCQFGSLSATWKQSSVAWLSQPLAASQGYLLMWQLWKHIHPNPPRLVHIQGTTCTLNVDVSYTCCSTANKPPGKQKSSQKYRQAAVRTEAWWPGCVTAKQTGEKKTHRAESQETMLYWHTRLMWLFC